MGTSNSKPFHNAYPFVNKQVVDSSGNCLTIDTDGYAYTESCDGAENQVFNYLPSGQLRQNGKCLVVDGGTTINGNRIKLGDCRIIGDMPSFHLRTLFENTVANPAELDQGWDITRPYVGGLFGTKTKIVNRLSKKCMIVSRGNKTEAVIWDCTATQNNDKYWTIKNPLVSIATKVKNRGGVSNIVADRIKQGKQPAIVNPPPVVVPPTNPPAITEPVVVTEPNKPPVMPSDEMQIVDIVQQEGMQQNPNYDIQLTSMTPEDIQRVKQTGEQVVLGPRTTLKGESWEITNTSFEFDLIIHQLPSLNFQEEQLTGPDLISITISQTDLAPGTVMNDGIPITGGETILLRNLILGPYTIWQLDDLKFYNPTGMEFDYVFQDNETRTASPPMVGAPFQSGLIQIQKACDSTNGTSKENKTYPPGIYNNTGPIAKMTVFPMTKVVIDGVFFDNQSLKPKDWNFCTAIKNPSEVIVEFSSNYIGLGVSRIQPQAPVTEKPIIEGFSSTQFNAYPIAMQGVGYSDSYDEAENDNFDNPESSVREPRDDKLFFAETYDDTFGEAYNDQAYDNNLNVLSSFDGNGRWFPSPVVQSRSIPGRSTSYWTDPGLETLALRKVDCGKYPLNSFGLSANNVDTRYRYNYQCGTDKDHEPFNGNDPRGQTHRLSDEVLLADLSSLFDLGVNCDGRAILGMQAVVSEGKLYYIYRCGKQPLTDFEQFTTPKVLGHADNIKPLLGLYVQCPEGKALSAWALNGYYARRSPHGDLNAYYYKYRCGLPIKPPHNEGLLEGFSSSDSDWTWLIVVIIILVIIILLKKR